MFEKDHAADVCTFLIAYWTRDGSGAQMLRPSGRREGWQCCEVVYLWYLHAIRRGEPDEYEYRVQATKNESRDGAACQLCEGTLRGAWASSMWATVGAVSLILRKKNGRYAV